MRACARVCVTAAIAYACTSCYRLSCTCRRCRASSSINIAFSLVKSNTRTARNNYVYNTCLTAVFLLFVCFLQPVATRTNAPLDVRDRFLACNSIPPCVILRNGTPGQGQPLNPFNPAYENTTGYRESSPPLRITYTAIQPVLNIRYQPSDFRSEGGNDEEQGNTTPCSFIDQHPLH